MPNEMKWTPGPWQLDQDIPHAVRDSLNRGVALTNVPGKPDEIAYADARLITVAPELYEATSNLLKMLEPDCSLEDIRYRAMYSSHIIGKARAVLAKARGESVPVQSPGDHQESNPGSQGGQNDFAPPVNSSDFRHPFEAVEGNQFCGTCGAGKLHGIHQGGRHAR